MRTPANPPKSLNPLAAAIGLALAGLGPAALAAPAVAHWTLTDLGMTVGHGLNHAGQVTGVVRNVGQFHRAVMYSNGSVIDLGTLGGSSVGYGINAAAQVTGYAYTAGNADYRAFLYSNGAMTDLGTLGGSGSIGYGINAAGQITGGAGTAGNAGFHAFLYSNGTMTDLGTLGGSGSVGYGINAAGQVTGEAWTAGNAAVRAFLHSNGTMTDLGTLGGSGSIGYGINAAAQVTGYAYTAGDAAYRAFVYSNGTMTDLGTLGGSDSRGWAINDAGQVTGSSLIAGNVEAHAFLYSNGTMTSLNTFNGVAGSGITLVEGRGLNDVGQIVANSASRGYLLTLDTTVWEHGSGAGWDTPGFWSHGIAPNRNTHAIIDPVRSLTVTGPTSNVVLRRLTIGGDASGGGGIATLQLNGGRISVTGDANGWQGAWVGQNGVLTGDGVLSVDSAAVGAVFNHGTIVAENLRVQSASSPVNAQILNHGLIVGNTAGPARIVSGYLFNESDGRIRVLAGERLTLQAAVGNYGSVEVLGGQFTHIGGSAFENVSTATSRGRIVAQGALLTFETGVNFSGGQLSVSGGTNNVFGAVTVQRSANDNRGGQIILSGNSQTTFYDGVDVKSGGELRVSTGSTAVFFGQVLQRTGALFTGTGTKFYEGGLTIGGSPGLALDSGDVNLGAGNVFTVDIGGTAACTAACDSDEALRNRSFDKYIVAGHLALGGTLTLVSWDGFVAQAGQRFDLLDWGSVSGSFDAIDASGLALGAGLALDTSRLALDGSVAITAVPEPGSWALMLAGVAFGTWRLRRRTSAAGRPGP